MVLAKLNDISTWNTLFFIRTPFFLPSLDVLIFFLIKPKNVFVGF